MRTRDTLRKYPANRTIRSSSKILPTIMKVKTSNTGNKLKDLTLFFFFLAIQNRINLIGIM